MISETSLLIDNDHENPVNKNEILEKAKKYHNYKSKTNIAKILFYNIFSLAICIVLSFVTVKYYNSFSSGGIVILIIIFYICFISYPILKMSSIYSYKHYDGNIHWFMRIDGCLSIGRAFLYILVNGEDFWLNTNVPIKNDNLYIYIEDDSTN